MEHKLTILVVLGTGWTDSYKSNYHTILKNVTILLFETTCAISAYHHWNGKLYYIIYKVLKLECNLNRYKQKT